MSDESSGSDRGLPVVGRDYKLAEPGDDVLQDRRESVEWCNLPPEKRFQIANEAWHRWNEIRGRSVKLAVQSLHNRLGCAE